MNKPKNIILDLLILIIFIETFFLFYMEIKKNLSNVEQIDNENLTTEKVEIIKPKEKTEKKVEENRKTLQAYKNETYGYQFKYSPNLVTTVNSSDENVILSTSPTGHWQNSIKVSPNLQKLPLDEIFNRTIKSPSIAKEDVAISDMFIGYRHAKKYSIKNSKDYGDTIIIFVNENNIFTIYGDESESATKSSLELLVGSFNFITAPTKEFFEKSTPYFIDSFGVYYIEQFNILNKLKDVDLETFKLIGRCASVEMSGASYAKDKSHIYINGNIAKNIDADSFKYLGLFNNYDGMPWSIAIAKDKNNIYYGCGKVINIIKKESFKVLDYGYAKDSEKIYYLNFNLKIADRDSFEVLGVYKINNIEGPFAMDKNNVYFEGRIIKEVSPENCKTKGIENCLPENWYDLLDDYDTSLEPLYKD